MMSLEQLTGCHARLQRELAIAFGAQPWPGARIERLADELAAAEAAIAELTPCDGLRSDSAAPQSLLRSR